MIAIVRRTLSPFLFMFASIVALLSASRLGLSLWQQERFSQLSDWSHVLIQGIRVDLSSIAYLVLLPFIIHFCLPKTGAVRA